MRPLPTLTCTPCTQPQPSHLLQMMGPATIRVRPSKTAIHTNTLKPGPSSAPPSAAVSRSPSPGAGARQQQPPPAAHEANQSPVSRPLSRTSRGSASRPSSPPDHGEVSRSYVRQQAAAQLQHRGALEAQKRSVAMAGLPSLHQQHQAAAQQQRYMLPPHQGMADPLMLAEAQRRAAMLGPHEQRQLLEAQLRGMQDPNSMFGRSSDIMSMSTAAMLHLQQQRGGSMGGPLMDPLMAMSRQMDPAAHQLSLQQRQLYSTLMGLPPQMLESHLASLQAAFMPRHYARGVGHYPESGRRSPPNLQNPMPSKRQRMH